MNSMCSQCHELVEQSYRSCPACGADLRVQVPRLVDLTAHEIDLERERADLLAAVVAAGEERQPSPRPRWGVDTPTMLPSGPAPKRGWLRR